MTGRVPPWWVRRLLIAPVVVVLGILLAPTEAMLGLVVLAVVTWVTPGRLRAPRIVWLAGFYLVWQAALLLVAFLLWVASGFGAALRTPAFQRAHLAVIRRALNLLLWQVRWTLRLQINVDTADVGDVIDGRPIVVASRHAGPGDSLLLVHTLLERFGRAPRIVLKDSLRWDPAIDVYLSRLPAVFVGPPASASGAPTQSAAVGALATDMGPQGALVVFPEGGNVTPRRRKDRILALRRAGRRRLADSAARMRHVMAPRAGGVAAALDAAPEAAVVFVGHTGLDRLVTVRDLWRELPMAKRIEFKCWAVAPTQVPSSYTEKETWLFDWWHRVDAWIAAHPHGPAVQP